MGDLANAVDLIGYAKAAGVNTVKFQYFDPYKMCTEYATHYWEGQIRNLRELYKEAYTPKIWFPALIREARHHELKFQVSVFDPSDIEFFEDLGVDSYKIASPEADWEDLITAVASTGKPTTISTGCLSRDQFIRKYMWERPFKDLTVLHCISKYPSEPEDCNMRTVQDLSELCGDIYKVGISNHCPYPLTSIVAVTLGARAIEMHLKLHDDYDNEVSLDSKFSLDSTEFMRMVYQCKEALKSIGTIKYGNPNHPLKRKLIDGKMFRK